MRLAIVGILALALCTQEIPVAHAQEQDVPHPALPAGAGPIDADAPKAFAATASGLRYRILRKGNDNRPTVKLVAGDDKIVRQHANTVKVQYQGWLDDGKVFDSSYERREPIEFPLDGVIAGWTEGMQLVGEGGMIELEIPAKLGYGARGVPGVIPPGSTLHFLVELIEVK